MSDFVRLGSQYAVEFLGLCREAVNDNNMYLVQEAFSEAALHLEVPSRGKVPSMGKGAFPSFITLIRNCFFVFH